MATKKISELPLITALSGSQIGGTVIPVVVGGTTDQISIENFSKFVTAYSATTASNNFIGNQTVNGNVTVTGKITAEEFHTEITSASIIYQEGSTQFGNDSSDTHTFTGTILLNGQSLGASQLNSQTASQYLVNMGISSITGSINRQTGSQDIVNFNLSKVTASIDAHILGVSKQTGSQDLVNFRNSTATSSLNFATSSIHSFTASQDSRNFTISQITASLSSHVLGVSIVTSSIDAHILKQSTQTGSQDIVNFNNSKVTASIDAHIFGISIYTSSANTTNTSIDSHILGISKQTGSQDLVNRGISSVTGSMNTQSSSQDLVNYQNSIVTSSFRNEIGGIEAYTASLKNAIIVNGTNVQIVGELDVARLNVQYVSSSVSYNSGSNIFGDASADKHEFTGSVNIADTLFIKGQAIGLGELNTQTGSQDLVNLSISTFTGSLRTELNNIEALTASFKAATILSSSTQIQNYDVFGLNSNLYTSTGSLIGITNGIMALTASMKAATIVSSSTQIQNYFTFAVTSSVNTFYGNQIVTGGLDVRDGVTGSFKGNLNGTATYAGTVSMGNSSTNQNYALVFTTAGSNGYLSQYTDAFGGMLYNPSTNKLTVSGSVEVSGSVYGNVTAQPVNGGNTASLDISNANFFTVTFADNITTHISASNVKAGQSVNILITTGTNTTASFSTNIKQPSGSFYLPTSGSGNKDVLSLVAFDSNSLYLVAVNQMI